MKKRDLFIPFSNGTESMIWLSNNCDKCKRYGCYEKKALDLSHLTGHITFNVAVIIGFDSHARKDDGTRYGDLKAKCKRFNKPMPKLKIEKHKNHPKLF